MEISFDKLLSIAKKNLLAMIAAGLVCFALVFAYMSFAVAPQYYSNVKFRISLSEEDERLSQTDLNTLRSLVPTYVAMLDTNDFYKQVQSSLPDDLRETYSYSAIKRGMSISSVGTTEIMSITFTCASGEDAERIVQVVYDCVEPRVADLTRESWVYLVDSPTPAATSGTKTNTYSILAFVLGAALVFAYFFILDMFDTRVKTEEDLSSVYGIPVLGAVPTFKTASDAGSKSKRG